MRRDLDGTIVLSARNLRTLLAKLDEPDSVRTLVAGRGGVNGHGGILVVKAEHDHAHYADRPAPGRMSSVTEATLRQDKAQS